MPKFPTLAHIDFAYTMVPDYFLDHVAPTLKECELKVMLYIYRRTLGYRKLGDCISYEQFIGGIITREGKRLDQGAGVSRRALVTALASLEQKGLISRSSGGYKATSAINLTTLALIAPEEPNRLTNITPNKEETQANPPVLTANSPSKKRQNLPLQEVQIGAWQVQNSPVGEPLKVQDSLSTRDTKSNQKIPCQNQVVVTPVLVTAIRQNDSALNTPQQEVTDNKAQLESIIQLLVQEIAGLKRKEAQNLAQQVLANRRDICYVKQILSYVNGNPAIRVPAAVLTTLIKTNQERQSESVLPVAKPAQLRSYPAALSQFTRDRTEVFFDDAPPATYPPERCNELWEQASQQVVERWQLDPILLAGGSLIAGENKGELRLVLPASDSLTRIRLSQAVKELVQVAGYQCQLIW